MGHLVYPIILPENIRFGVFVSNRFSRWSRNLWSSLTWADCSRKPLNPKHGLQIIRLLQGLCNTEPGNLVPWDSVSWFDQGLLASGAGWSTNGTRLVDTVSPPVPCFSGSVISSIFWFYSCLFSGFPFACKSVCFHVVCDFRPFRDAKLVL